MGDCRYIYIDPNGERRLILDIGPTWPDPNEPEDNDPGHPINGGVGSPVLKPEWRWR
jgi:hypothetical protein